MVNRRGAFDTLKVARCRGDWKAGQLRDFAQNWIMAGAPKSLIKMITGYAIPFCKKPPSIPFSTASIQRLQTSVDAKMYREISNMLATGVLQEVPSSVKSGFFQECSWSQKQTAPIAPFSTSED
ncbi:unnamed protein product [Acanthoscelides obtectus]|uniref:Uncharacterized protein n=1 Tax=Acanthoscelides obtectus TaxID=200917 RepID=A0A9P0QGV3_ACAOB|nr:unnamed protein product [Acanthoscelides obtectus]CAK1682445.1 hypothetical protein AOBTE_LOCUS33634 [Acanthoscelides obtectus]